MCDCNYDNCGCNDECVPCAPVNCIEQAVNDALAQEKETLEGYVDDAKASADTASQAASDASGFRDEAKGYRDQAEVAANTATEAVPAITEAVITIQETADAVKKMGENLEDQIKDYLDDVSFLPWVYNNGTANGGETSVVIEVDGGTVLGVASVYVNGNRQHEGLGYTFDSATQTLSLADALEEGDELIAFVSTEVASPDATNISNYRHVAWLYNNGSANGGETVLTPPYTFKLVPAIYHNGARKVVGLHYQPQSNNTITLKFAVAKGDIIQVILGGTPDEFYAQADSIFTTLAQEDGASKVGIVTAGNTVEDSLLSQLRANCIRISDTGWGFANWPQGKGISFNNKFVTGYNLGAGHTSQVIDAMFTSTRDGKNWTQPRTIAAHTDTESATAWMIGKDVAETTLFSFVRFRGTGGDTGAIRYEIYKSVNSGTTWTYVQDLDFESDAGNPAVAFHGFALMGDGRGITGYHCIDGEFGVLLFDTSTFEYTKVVLLTPAQNLNNGNIIHVEANFLVRSDNGKILITSRSQFAGVQKPSVWVAEDNFTSVSDRVETTVPFSVNPVTPVFSPDFTKVLFFYCFRYSQALLTAQQASLWVAELPIEEAFALNWANAKTRCLVEMSGEVSSSAATAGVQHAALVGNRIFVPFASMVEDNLDRSDVYCLTLDYKVDNLKSGANTYPLGSLKGSQYGGKAELRLDVIGPYNPRIRMNGRSVFALETALQIGSYASNFTQGLGLYTYNGGAQTPALFIQPNTVSYGGNTGPIDLNRDVRILQANRTLHLGAGFRIRIGGDTTTLGQNLIYHNTTDNQLEFGSTQAALPIKIVTFSAEGIEYRRTGATGAAINLRLRDSSGNISIISGGGSVGGIAFSTPTVTQAVRIADNGALNVSREVKPGDFLISTLPSSAALGGIVYVRNGLKAGETAGNGTGCPAYFDGTVWRYVRDDSVVS